jgi:hypothetical protein
MKSKTLIYFLVVLLVSCVSCVSSTEVEGGLFVTEDRLEVVFSTSQTAEDLKQIATELSEREIKLEYKGQFDSDGLLTGIDFTVDYGDGFKGSAKTNWLGLSGKFGFFRDYSPGAEIVVFVGKLK